MPPVASPKLDRRTADELLWELLEHIPHECPEWKAIQDLSAREPALALARRSKDFGVALLKLAARMGEVIVEQFNRVPEKNFLAFLDLVGITLLPPKAARVPLTFTLVEKAPANVKVKVPKGTKVGVADVVDVVFETEEDLDVNRVPLARACSLHPLRDRFADLAPTLTGALPRGRTVFSSDAEWDLVTHALYIGHPSCFREAAEAGQSVTIEIEPDGILENLALTWEYSGSKGWTTVAQAGARQFRPEDIKETVVKGFDKAGTAVTFSNYWLRARTTRPLPPPAQLPAITSIRASVAYSKAGLKPEAAFTNNIPIDLTKDFFPFGERPKLNDTFYFASREVFSKAGAAVTLQVELSEIFALPNTAAVTLKWEYWGHGIWNELGVTDGTNALRGKKVGETVEKRGTVTFTCPAIEPCPVNDQENYWLRVRIVGGNYGVEAGYKEKTDKSGYEYTEPTFKPPALKSLTLSYTYNAIHSDLTILTENDGVLERIGTAREFQPFVHSLEESPGLYLGFADSLNAPALGAYLSPFFQLEQPRYDTVQVPQAEESTPARPDVVWKYWDGKAWALLPVEDETRDFSQDGRVRFLGPSKWTDRILFGQRLFWVKASLEKRSYEKAPRLQGIFMNTVWARHGVTFTDQVLGASNGEPNQSFSLQKPPVLEGEIIEIREATILPEGERRKIIEDEGPDALRTVTDEAGNLTEVWVRWRETPTFNLSGPTDRHYVLDRAKGLVFFGDGVRGGIPPPGRGGVRAALYRTGGGAAGNCGVGTVTELKTTIPFVDAVTNHQLPTGGSDLETLEAVKVRGPRSIKTRDRAVTVDDFEWLACQASRGVAKAKCLPMTLVGGGGLVSEPGWVTVMVVPEGEEDQPVPMEPLLRMVRDYLAARAVAPLSTRIQVIGPTYVSVNVTATVRVMRIEEAKAVEKLVLENVKAFLHPVRGGPKAKGWEFGRNVYLSEVSAVILGTEGVDRVDSAALGHNFVPVIEIPPSGLPSSGQHTITIEGR